MARDRVVILDDICKSTNRKKQINRRDIAASLIRIAANETSVIKKCGQSEQKMNCMASLAITGEIPMEAASDITRCLIVELTKPLTDDLEALRPAAAAALKGYLTWLSQHYEQECSQLRKDYEEWYNTRTSMRLIRVQTSHFELRWLLCSFLRYTKEAVGIGEKAERQFRVSTEQAFTVIWNKTDEMVRSVEQTERPLSESIWPAISTNNLKAFMHNGCVCIRSEDLTKYFQKLYNRSDISKRDVTALLRDEKMLSTDKSGRSTKKIDGKRYLCIPLSVFQCKAYKLL